MSDIKKLLRERNTQYADAWKKSGLISQPIAYEIAALHHKFPEGWYSWGIILNKLCRILGDPKNIDSWRDIAGYATLVVEHLEGEPNEVPTG